MNDTALEQSEKDMIGSLLEDDPSECSEFRSSLTRSQKNSISSPIKCLKESPELREDYKEQITSFQDFPTNDPQNYYISTFPSIDTTLRPHSMSQEPSYYNQYYIQAPIQNYYNPCQEGYFSQKRTRKQPPIELNEQGIVLKYSYQTLQCQDQYASLIVQSSFINGNEIQKEKIFKAMEEDLIVLSKHRFGNYVIQKIIENGTNSMRCTIFNKLINKLIEMCYDKFGCRVIQKLLEYITMRKQEKLLFISQVKPNLMELIFDQCGNHVIQKLIDLVPNEETDFIIEMVNQNVDQIISHSYGCRIAQKCLETYPNEKLQELYCTLTPLCDGLSFCQYGNYIVQHMIMQGPQRSIETLGKFIKQNLIRVSQDKFASNVAQRYITKADDDEIMDICRQILNQNIGPLSALLILINNQFGNYVMQNLYSRSNDKCKLMFQQQIRRFEDHMFSPYGRHFLQYMAKIPI